MKHVDTCGNLVNLFESAVERFNEREMFGTKGQDGKFHYITYSQVGKRVDNLRGGLAAIGVGPNDKVGIIANNRPEWLISAMATYGRGAQFVPMYEAELEKYWRAVVEDAGVKLLIVSRREIFEKVRHYIKEVPTVEKVVVIDSAGEGSLLALEKMGIENLTPPVYPGIDDTAVIIYTSGTTGRPKGVMLTHGNLTSNAAAGYHRFPSLNEKDRALSILPWAHSYGQLAELYNFLQFGASIAFNENIDCMIEDLAEVRPTCMIAVPRIFNKVYGAVHAKMEADGGIAKRLFNMGINAGNRRRKLEAMGEKDLFTNIKYFIARLLVFRKIRNKFGGRLELCLTASAPVNEEVLHFFWDIGLHIYNAYGLTEAAPAVTLNYVDNVREGSVGKPIQYVDVRIDKTVVEDGAEDGEIVVYGPNIMKGYHNMPAETAKVIMPDGGLRTGDRGRFDEDGFLYITGRIKEQYKLENGKYVFPASIEEELKLIPCIENAFVYGEGRPYNVCLVYPDLAVIEEYARTRDLPTDPASLADSAEVMELIRTEVTGFLEGKYGRYEIPQRFALIFDDFTIENGMLTPSLKLKRAVVSRYYDDIIEGLFSEYQDRVEEQRKSLIGRFDDFRKEALQSIEDTFDKSKECIDRTLEEMERKKAHLGKDLKRIKTDNTGSADWSHDETGLPDNPHLKPSTHKMRPAGETPGKTTPSRPGQ